MTLTTELPCDGKQKLQCDAKHGNYNVTVKMETISHASYVEVERKTDITKRDQVECSPSLAFAITTQLHRLMANSTY